MGLEEHTIEEIEKRCQRCGAELKGTEISATMEDGVAVFLCTSCSAEELPSVEDELES